MSIKGFVINGQTEKYDYEALDNKPESGGVTDAVRQALLQLASKVAYIDADGADYYQDLYDALYAFVISYTVTNFLTDVTSTNQSTSVTDGSEYEATLSCASNYEITTISVTMGGIDVTNTVYSNGTISIPSVTGNIVITAVATQRATLDSIEAVFTQGTAVIYDNDSLSTLKQYLVVTATWGDSSTSVLSDSDYTLSGSLTAGTSTITVSYGGETDTFTVTVTESRGTIFGTFHNNWAIGKKTKSSQGGNMPMYACWNNETSARAAMLAPIENNGYVFTVTDSSLYNLAVYGFEDDTEYATDYDGAVNGKYFQGDTESPSFAASGSSNANYVMLSLKRMSGSFTTTELENGAEAVFTYTTSA